MQLRILEFLSLTGDILLILEDTRKEIIWSSILERIAMEEWYQTYHKWRFVLGFKNLEPNDVLDSDSISFKITCLKIFVPQISFVLPSGESLVSIPFEDCKQLYDLCVCFFDVCFRAHKKLTELGKDGYGTHKTKIQPMINTYKWGGRKTFCLNENYSYILCNNGILLKYYDVLKIPEDDNLIIVVVPEQVYCNHCCGTKFHGPLRVGEQRKVIREIIRICPDCGFLHCSFCGMYRHHMIKKSKCCTTHYI